MCYGWGVHSSGEWWLVTEKTVLGVLLRDIHVHFILFHSTSTKVWWLGPYKMHLDECVKGINYILGSAGRHALSRPSSTPWDEIRGMRMLECKRLGGLRVWTLLRRDCKWLRMKGVFVSNSEMLLKWDASFVSFWGCEGVFWWWGGAVRDGGSCFYGIKVGFELVTSLPCKASVILFSSSLRLWVWKGGS